MATTVHRAAFSGRPRSHHKSPSTDSFLADSLSRYVQTLAEEDPITPSLSPLPPRHSPRSTLSPMSSSSSTPSSMRSGHLRSPSAGDDGEAGSSRGFHSPRDVPRRIAMRLLVGDSSGFVDAATPRLAESKPSRGSGASGGKYAGARGGFKSGDSGVLPQDAEAGRGGRSRHPGGASMFRSASEHVGYDVTTPTSPASPASPSQRPSSRGRYLAHAGASEPLERTSRPRKSRLRDDENAGAMIRDCVMEGDEVQSEDEDAAVLMRRLEREMQDLRRQLERCSRINKWLTESLRAAERTAAEATAAAQAAESERDHVAKELEEMLNAWSHADESNAAKQEEERASTERSRASLERARAALAQEKEAVEKEREEVRREREEMKRERDAWEKERERMVREATKRGAKEVQSEWNKLQKQAEMMNAWQHQHPHQHHQHHQHHVTPDGVLLRSVSMNSTCNCLHGGGSIITEIRPINGGATSQKSKLGSRKGNGSSNNEATGWMPSHRSESDLASCTARTLQHHASGLPHSVSSGECGVASPQGTGSPAERVGRLWNLESCSSGAIPLSTSLSPTSRSPRNNINGYSSSSLSSVGSYSSVLDYGAKPPKSPGVLPDPRTPGRRVKFSLVD